MLLKHEKPCPSSDNGSSHYRFKIFIQVKDKSRAKKKSIMDYTLIKIIIFFLPFEAHLPIVEALYLSWMQDLHHAHVIGVVFLVIVKGGSKARVLHNSLCSRVPCKVTAPIIRNWMQGNIVFWALVRHGLVVRRNFALFSFLSPRVVILELFDQA